MFSPYLKRWSLVPDGDPIITPSSRLLPVRHQGEPAMLKVPLEAEEQWGWLPLTWWNGDGAVRVLAQHHEVLLLERAVGGASLASWVRTGHDDEASRVICSVAAKLHAHPGDRPAELIPLETCSAELEPAAATYGGILHESASASRTLFAAPRDVTVLHGDLHHGNVLDFGARGWLVIDPKRLLGERGFDFANIFCNPDREVATEPGRLARQSHTVAEAAGLDRRRLLQWILAYAGLSAAWWLGDGVEPVLDLAVATAAKAELALL